MNKCENYEDFPTSIFKINLPKGKGKSLKIWSCSKNLIVGAKINIR